MATSTTNYSLRKPDDVDNVSVELDLGSNFDTIDTELKRVDVMASDYDTRTQWSYVTADDTVNNTTAYKTLDSVNYAVEASGIYALDFFLLYHSSTVADFKFDINAPAGSHYYIAPAGIVTATGSGGGDIDLGVNEDTITGTAGRGANNLIACISRGILIVSNTAGSVVLQYAQNTAEASNTVLKKGSWMRAFKLN